MKYLRQNKNAITIEYSFRAKLYQRYKGKAFEEKV